jgi:hypothetical protein
MFCKLGTKFSQPSAEFSQHTAWFSQSGPEFGQRPPCGEIDERFPRRAAPQPGGRCWSTRTWPPRLSCSWGQVHVVLEWTARLSKNYYKNFNLKMYQYICSSYIHSKLGH